MKKACRCKPRNEATSKERADIHDTSPDAFNALAQPTGNSNALLHQLRPGTIDNTSSDEAFNGGIKKALDRNRGKVANQINAISRHLKATSEREYQLFGISHIPPIFPAHDRFKGDAEADQMRIGMCFLGRCDKKLFMDQRQILSMQGQGADLRVYMINREEDLFELHKEVDDAKKRGDTSFDYASEKYNRVSATLKRFHFIHNASKERLTRSVQEKASEVLSSMRAKEELLANESMGSTRLKTKATYLALDRFISDSNYFVVLTPARADRQELSKKRGRGRPKKAAPALQRMDPNLEVDPGLKSVVANV
mmetsp:Transcript_19771/g.30355  ORF Transcript_19771/g.30355 Transcript_19771/m.30355 type:complete len:310 (-) Transcript_19771:64-993(-)